MRQARIKIPADEGPAVYHCVTRTVNGEWLFDDIAKEVLRKQIWQVADFCGVEVITYAILSNHFHVLVRVPQREEITDPELLRRFAVLHPRPSPYQTARLQVIKHGLSCNTPEAVAWRKQFVALMNDISQFMKLLKQRFSIWFNKSHRRFGTLWAERFRSVLVEGRDHVLQTVAAFDLNPVRAGLVRDPKDYRFCGYAEAVAGREDAQRAIRTVTGGNDWGDSQCQYRALLFGTAAGARESAASLSSDELQRIVQQGGILSRSEALRCRLRFLTYGAILGTRAFVSLQLVARRMTFSQREPRARELTTVCNQWGDLATLHGFRTATER
jgi:REP element-mobilizing transposase RayT